MGIFDSAEQIDGVDDFFGGVEVALPLDYVANAPMSKRLQIVMNIGELAEKKRDVFRLSHHLFASGVNEAQLSQHFILEPRGETFPFEAAGFFGIDFFIRRDDFPYDHSG